MTRNERKRLAKAKAATLSHNLAALAACKAWDDAIKARREAAIHAVSAWGRPLKGIGVTSSTLNAFVRR